MEPIAGEETVLDADAYVYILQLLADDVRDICNFARALRVWRSTVMGFALHRRMALVASGLRGFPPTFHPPRAQRRASTSGAWL